MIQDLLFLMGFEPPYCCLYPTKEGCCGVHSLAKDSLTSIGSSDLYVEIFSRIRTTLLDKITACCLQKRK